MCICLTRYSSTGAILQSVGNGESFYRGLVSEEMLERVQEYMGNTTLTDFFYDVNATLAFYLPDSLRVCIRKTATHQISC